MVDERMLWWWMDITDPVPDVVVGVVDDVARKVAVLVDAQQVAHQALVLWIVTYAW